MSHREPLLVNRHDDRQVTSAYKAYEVDPLECPRCKSPMRVIALIDDTPVIRKILTHLGLWMPQVEAGRGPGPPAADPPASPAQILTYHPVPDIA